MRGLRMKWGRGDPTATTAAAAVAALHTMDGHCSSEKVGPPSTRRAAAEGRGYSNKKGAPSLPCNLCNTAMLMPTYPSLQISLRFTWLFFDTKIS